MSHKTTTALGTHCAKSWTPAWIAVVEKGEAKLGRRICGARLLSGSPCSLVSTHASGRCRHHGGFNHTGAPEGNRNAVLHNLYSRRLMPCGSHCPMWQSCPLGGGSPDQGAAIVKLHAAERPTCPYEQTEYSAALTDLLERVPKKRALSYGRHLAHQVALAQVMLSRAGLALREAEFAKPSIISSEKYNMTTPKLNPALEAYERLDRAYRLLLRQFEALYTTSWQYRVDDPPYHARTKTDTQPDPDSLQELYEIMMPPEPEDDEDWDDEDEYKEEASTPPPQARGRKPNESSAPDLTPEQRARKAENDRLITALADVSTARSP